MNNRVAINEPTATYSPATLNIISGVNEGLAMPFVLVTGLSRVMPSADSIFIIGTIATAVGAITMGFGRYWVSKTELHHHDESPHHEHAVAGDGEKEKIKSFYNRLDLPEDIQNLAAAEVIKDKNEWAGNMPQFDKAASKTIEQNITAAALFLSIGYIAGGLLAVLPYILLPVEKALPLSIIVVIALLFIFSIVKAVLLKINPWAAALRNLIISLAAAGAAYWVATIFRH